MPLIDYKKELPTIDEEIQKKFEGWKPRFSNDHDIRIVNQQYKVDDIFKKASKKKSISTKDYEVLYLAKKALLFSLKN